MNNGNESLYVTKHEKLYVEQISDSTYAEWYVPLNQVCNSADASRNQVVSSHQPYYDLTMTRLQLNLSYNHDSGIKGGSSSQNATPHWKSIYHYRYSGGALESLSDCIVWEILERYAGGSCAYRASFNHIKTRLSWRINARTSLFSMQHWGLGYKFWDIEEAFSLCWMPPRKWEREKEVKQEEFPVTQTQNGGNKRPSRTSGRPFNYADNKFAPTSM